jgi:glycosyltransferase involved in cell wall biosynthesis
MMGKEIPTYKMQKRLLFVIDSLVGGGAERIMNYLVNKLDKDRFKISLCLSLGSRIDYEIPKETKLYLPQGTPFLNTIALLLIQLLIRPAALLYNIFKLPFIKNFNNSYRELRRYLGDFFTASSELYSIIDIFTASSELYSIIEKEKPDLIISFLPNSNIIALFTKSLFKVNVPICCSDHNTLSKEIESLPYPFLRSIISKFLYKKADLHIAVSEGAKQDLNFQFKISAKKIVTIYNGVDIDFIKTQSQEPIDSDVKKIFSDDNAFKIINIGRLTTQKGHEYLLRAFKKVKSQINCRLFILGKGEKQEFLKSLSMSLGIDDYVHFLGWHKNPFKFIACCDLFVLSSIWEGFPVVLIEAMSLNLPVISTNCPSGPSEILDNGKYGILVHPKAEDELADAIIQVLSNKDLRIKLSQMSTARASDFTLEKMLHNYEDIFTREL